MKPTEIEPLPQGWRSKSGTGWLNQILIWSAILLVAAISAIGVDLYIRSGDQGQIVRAVEPNPATPLHTALSTQSSTPPPSIEPTATSEPPTATPVPMTVVEPTAAEPVTPQACVPPDDWGIHIVQPGNTLYSLARRYGTDVDTLMGVNCLNTNTIFTNQRLYVPGPVASRTVVAVVATQPPATQIPEPDLAPTASMEMVAGATPFPTATPRSEFQVDISENYVNIALLGSDRRPNTGHWRTDSIIIVSVDTKTNIVRLLSIPRDLWVFIPQHGYNRVNTADLWGELNKKGTGPDRVKQTIHQNLGIPIHYYVRIDFKGFMNIVDTVGGIDVDVDCPLPDIKLSAGMHHMDGKDALRYARSRKSTSDFDRGRRQRKVLLALWDQALTMDIIPKLPQLWKTMSDSFQTDLPLSQVINLAYVGVQLTPQHILSTAIGPKHVQSWRTPEGASVLLPQDDKIRALLESFYAPVDRSTLNTTDKVRVRVLNGSQRQEAEGLAAANLKWEGFSVVDTGPADHQDYAQTKILVFNGDMASAQKVATDLRLTTAYILDLTATQQQPDPAQPVDIQVVIGGDYNPCRR